MNKNRNLYRTLKDIISFESYDNQLDKTYLGNDGTFDYKDISSLDSIFEPCRSKHLNNEVYQ